MNKECKRCGVVKPLSDFAKGNCKDGRTGACKECLPKREPWLKGKDPAFIDAYKHNGQLWTKFRMRASDYAIMLEKQGGVCAICKQPETFMHPKAKRVARLAVDHCHDTGKVRGLLCAKCNRGLGYFRHNVAYLRNAEEYLNE